MVRPIAETEAAWVADYFGEDYLRLYQFPADRTDPEVAFVAEELAARIPAGGEVLDLCCGQGRHAIPLAQMGFRITGIDLQENLLAVARQKAGAADVALTLLQGDMRELNYTAEFDTVINLFSAFGYFSDEENALVLGLISRALRPGGIFIIDVANRDALVRHAQQHSWKRLPDGTLVISEWQWDARHGRYHHWQLLVNEQQQREYRHSVRVYSCSELCALLAQAGLQVENVYGSFQREALGLDTPRMICVSHKM